MKRLVFLFISGTLMFINGGCGREDSSDLIKLKSLKNCAGCNLIEAKLSKIYLKGADLSNANLSGADLTRANLKIADLSGANLKNADLSNADLTKADLSGAKLIGANLSGADLTRANFINSILEKISTTKETIFCNTKFPWGIENSGCKNESMK